MERQKLTVGRDTAQQPNITENIRAHSQVTTSFGTQNGSKAVHGFCFNNCSVIASGVFLLLLLEK